MFDSFEPKGKIFTDVITKEPTDIILQTCSNRIEGKLYVRPNHRLKDEINEQELFVAITDAVVYNNDGEMIYQSKFIAVNQSQIVWIIPKNELSDGIREETA